MYVCMYICMYITPRLKYIRTHIVYLIYICTYTNMHTYIYIYIHTHTPGCSRVQMRPQLAPRHKLQQEEDLSVA